MKSRWKWHFRRQSKAEEAEQPPKERCSALASNEVEEPPRRSLMDLPPEILLLIIDAYVAALDLDDLARFYYDQLDKLIKISMDGDRPVGGFTRAILNIQRSFWIDALRQNHLHEANRFMYDNIRHLIICEADQFITSYRQESKDSWLAFRDQFSLRISSNSCFIIRHGYIRPWSVFLDNRALWLIEFAKHHEEAPAGHTAWLRTLARKKKDKKTEGEATPTLSPKRAVYRSTLPPNEPCTSTMRSDESVTPPEVETKWMKEARITRRHLQQQVLDQCEIVYRVPVTIARDQEYGSIGNLWWNGRA